jgi:Got1/Sft2-like family
MSNFFNFDQENKTEEETDSSCLPALSFKERLIGFFTCMSLGILIEFISLGSMIGLLTGSPTRYALSFTLGNILSILGTGFLLGFKRQLKSAVDEKRRYTTLIFFISMIMTLVSIFYIQKPLLVLCFVIIQICSYVWYIASYFPWGRTILMSCLKKCSGRCTDDS